ncbi:MAG: hypothetical protein RIR62_2191 [Pseudomonadota bacterium]
MIRALALLAALLPTPLPAAETVWVEVTGQAFRDGAGDDDSARRRAVADALLQAALAGGASVAGHTVMDRSVVTSDLLIVRPVGRVLGHEVLALRRTAEGWQATIRARVGAQTGGACPDRRRLVVTAYRAGLHVSPRAPAWTEPLAGGIIHDLLRALARHPQVELVRTTQRALPMGGAAQDGFDYVALTRGSVRLPAGEHAFVPELRIDVTGGAGGRDRLVMTLDVMLVGGDGTVLRQRLTREAAMPAPSPFGRAAVLVEPDRRAMSAALLAGVDRAFSDLLAAETCKPVSAILSVAGGTISVPVGRRMGVTRGSIAFTADAGHSTEMLEVVGLSANSASLRPLDPARPAAAFAGRPVRFVQTGQ